MMKHLETSYREMLKRQREKIKFPEPSERQTHRGEATWQELQSQRDAATAGDKTSKESGEAGPKFTFLLPSDNPA